MFLGLGRAGLLKSYLDQFNRFDFVLGFFPGSACKLILPYFLNYWITYVAMGFIARLTPLADWEELHKGVDLLE